MTVRLFSGAVIGLDAFPVEVEVDATPGLHLFSIVGLPDKTVQESRDRIQAALRNSGFVAPKQKNQRITVNLAPADIKKEGSGYDLVIAVGYLITTKQLVFESRGTTMIFGELGLDGSVRRISGILPLVQMAKLKGFKEVLVPIDNVGEAAMIAGIRIIPVATLQSAVGHINGKSVIPPATQTRSTQSSIRPDDQEVSMSDIRGQESAKRALVVAASGGHNVLMYGPPGSGKTLLARALSGILPPLSDDEALEITKIYSVAGLTENTPFITYRPFRNPHHTSSSIAIIGGGSWPRPGEVTLAHRGVLFLDEFPEFPRSVIEVLRQPMESGDVTIARANSTVRFPARFMLVAAMNPCPCGNFWDENQACICSEQSISRYQKKLSGPILDRIDIQIVVPRETYSKLAGAKPASAQTGDDELSSQIVRARDVQTERYAKSRHRLNSELGPREIHHYCPMTKDAEKLVEMAVTANNLSARAYHKLLKLGRTIADLDRSNIIDSLHIGEAIGYRIKVD